MTVRLADFLWDRLPRAVERWSDLLGAALRDGSEITRWPQLAVLLPAAALMAGLVVGVARPASDDTYTYSVLWVGPLLAAATLGAAMGFWAWAGYAIGDFLFYHHAQFIAEPIGHIWQEMIPLFVIGNLLLFALLVAMPLAVSDLRRRALGRVREPKVRLAVGFAARVAAALVLSAIWVSSARVLIRPLFLWHAAAAPVAAIETLHANLVVLLVIALAGSIAREVVVQRSAPESALAGPEAAQGPSGAILVRARARPPTLVGFLKFVLVAALTTLGLAGLTEDLSGLVLLFAALFAAWVLRRVVLPRVPAYVRLVTAVPLVARVVMLAAVTGAIGRAMLDAPNGLLQAYQSFAGVTLTVVASILVSVFLLPPEIPQSQKGSQP